MDLTDEIRELFAEEMAGKFLATADAGGRVNAAAIVTLQPPADGRKDRLIFGEFLMNKTKRNLMENTRVAAAVVNMKMRTAAVVGDFQGFEATGPYKDTINSSDFVRYNAYTGVRTAGVIDIREIGLVRSAIPAVAIDQLRLRLRRAGRNGGVIVPRPVREKFLRLSSVKALAVMGGDGYPRIFPVMTVVPAGERGFTLRASSYNRELADVEVPCRAALCVLTMDAIAYQVKGELRALSGSTFALGVEEVYSSSPPLAGDLIAPRTGARISE